ncbi:MAG: DMT family transporter [Deltaproteobacteria bacterium]|nr:DMT family transporter [Deltaproteobacteria bacterium]
MRAELWAVLTGLCWGIGSLMEKKGVRIGGLSPVMGTTLRTAVSLAVLAAFSIPFWSQMRTAGPVSLALVAVGGGVISGALGILCLYAGLRSGSLSTVMAIAFCLAPVAGAFLGWLVLHERLTPLQLLGVVLCVTGAGLVTLCRAP